jgi:hypothetical protein
VCNPKDFRDCLEQCVPLLALRSIPLLVSLRREYSRIRVMPGPDATGA